jgi:hypothetical protein
MRNSMRESLGGWLATAQEKNVEIGCFVLTILLIVLINEAWSLYHG